MRKQFKLILITQKAYNNLGKILGELNNVNEAKKYFEKSLNLDENEEKNL